ncbi:MAG: alpha-ketoglutarate-dependent dioxygenase AlkB [Porticoccaceae bacterium]
MLPLGGDETLVLRDGQLRYWPAFVEAAERAALFARLRAETPWKRSEISIAGRRIPIPRLNAWYGDPGADYSYSGVRLVTTPWTPLLSRVRERVEAATGLVFNSALLNLYRDGADSVDWHADDEPELGEAPQVASLSLGAVRRFELKHRTIPGQRYRLELPDGSLLLMAGPLQRHWLHRVPKEPRIAEARINITFRSVRPAPAQGRLR